MLTFQTITQQIKGVVIAASNLSYSITQLVIDSRHVFSPDGVLFFAIQTSRNDGHRYIPELYAKGVRNFIVTKPIQLPSDANVFQVENSVRALQEVAAFHRKQFDYPVLGITGSNGKTIVKEWLFQLLAPTFNIAKSPKSYNSQIGVPLSVWQMQQQHQLGIFEAGISQPNEMKYLQAVIQPTCGIFTNLGSAHDEGFENAFHKFSEKWQLFKDCPAVIYHQKPGQLANWIEKTIKKEQELWGWQLEKKENFTYQFSVKQHSFTIHITQFADAASLENIGHCVAAMVFLGVEPTEIEKRLQYLQPLPMRLELKEGINGCYLVDDSYNNDRAGLQTALDVMRQQKKFHQLPHTLILSDFLQTVQTPEQLAQELQTIFIENNISRWIGVGKQMQEVAQFFPNNLKCNVQTYNDTEQFLAQIQEADFQQELILIKGARTFGFEQITKRLQQKHHGTRLEINLNALVHNFNYYRNHLKKGVKTMVMVKAFAYGAGSYEVANLLAYHKADYLAVAYTDEGIALRKAGIKLPIMVMNPTTDSLGLLQQYDLEPEVYSFTLLQQVINIAKKQKYTLKIHLKIDTGMRRLGFERQEVAELIQVLQQNASYVSVVSVFSHLVASDAAEHDGFTKQQIAVFLEVTQQLQAKLQQPFLRHILNTGGILRFPEAQLDMVRLGIGLYGAAYSNNKLQEVATLKTTISQIKSVKKGETVGYNRKGVVMQDTRIATIAIGYADGYDRRLSNGTGKVCINGQFAPVIGNVCMDMTMIDIGNISAKEGDEVIVWGSGAMPIQQVAEQIGTISYELLTQVGERVKRVFYTD